MMYKRKKVALLVLTILGITTFGMTGCTKSNEQAKGTVTLVSYQSFNMPDDVVAQFEKETGFTLDIQTNGDSSEVLARATTLAGKPDGDVLFGVDNLSLTLAENADIFTAYTPKDIAKIVGQDPTGLTGSKNDKHLLTPIDRGDVCVNADTQWFNEHGLALPTSLEDLADPQYRSLLVVEDPNASSPGKGFLAASVAAFGEDEYQTYWAKLKENDVKIAASWDDAYLGDYTVSGGDRPLVVSYATSPAAEVLYSDGKVTQPRSTIVWGTCFGQVEYAGILKGAPNSAGAKALIDFLVSRQWQDKLSAANLMLPMRDDAQPGELFVTEDATDTDILALDPAVTDAHMEEWITAWTQQMQ